MKTIPLTNSYMTALVDDSFEDIRGWYLYKQRNTYYAMRWVYPDKQLSLHRLLLPGVAMIDHINGNGLDNRLCNLRPCTAAQNCANMKIIERGTSRFKGVHWNKRSQKWCASIRHHRKLKHLGLFSVEEQAAHAYNTAALQLFGEFARLNLLGSDTVTK